jgi:hypothetical protein
MYVNAFADIQFVMEGWERIPRYYGLKLAHYTGPWRQVSVEHWSNDKRMDIAEMPREIIRIAHHKSHKNWPVRWDTEK